MRLIDAEALRKEVIEKVHFMTVDGHIAYDKMLKLIDSAPPVDIADRPQGMNDILRSLIKWTEENKVIPEIYFMCVSGAIWLNLVLRYHGQHIKHEFYVPGGVLCLNNWDMFPTEEEVNLFIEEAKEELLKKGDKE